MSNTPEQIDIRQNEISLKLFSYVDERNKENIKVWVQAIKRAAAVLGDVNCSAIDIAYKVSDAQAQLINVFGLCYAPGQYKTQIDDIMMGCTHSLLSVARFIEEQAFVVESRAKVLQQIEEEFGGKAFIRE